MGETGKNSQRRNRVSHTHFSERDATQNYPAARWTGTLRRRILPNVPQYYGPFLLHKWTKVATILLLIVYLAVSIWGCTQTREGLEYSKGPSINYVTRGYVRRRRI